MKKQSEILANDLYPDYGTERKFGAAYDKQAETIWAVYTQKMKCPCCNEFHTMNELFVNSPETEKAPTDRNIFCLKTGEELQHHTPLFAYEGDWITRKSNDPIN